MIGLDTNVLLRFTLKDDDTQYALAEKLFRTVLTAEAPGFVNTVVLVEFAWTLRRTYKLGRERICAVVAHLLGSKNIVFERSEIVAQALDLSDGQDIELPDAIIAAINRDESCTHTVTFDERFASSGAATLLK